MGETTTSGRNTMNDAQIASWLSTDAAAWVSIVAPALVAIGVLVFVVVACIRHKRSRGLPPAAPREAQRSPRSAGVVFFPR
jgi:hypothetical protein